MFKLLLIVIFITALDAGVVKITTQGTYTQPKYSLQSHTPDETLFARKQALAMAKENAAQEAGTTIYSQISSKYDNKKDTYEFKSDLKAISSAIVTYKIIKEGWRKDVYFVKIQAKVDVADAEEIFNKADKRLQKIKDLQSENETILAALKNVADKIMTLNRNKYTSENIYEIKKLNSKIEDNQFEQSKLVREYEDNIYNGLKNQDNFSA